jgi:hypothetical protein
MPLLPFGTFRSLRTDQCRSVGQARGDFREIFSSEGDLDCSPPRNKDHEGKNQKSFSKLRVLRGFVVSQS